MHIVTHFKALISEMDREARRELSTAAAEGRFEDLVQLTPIAKEIAALAARWGSDIQETPPVTDVATVREDQGEATESPMPSSVRTSKSKPKKANYPQFLREKDELVKIGWSPREKGTYEHRVPKIGVNAVTAAVATKGKAGHRFTMDEIMKAIGETNGSEQFPSYQIYAVLAWLKWAGMVLQHGRQGYTIVRPQTFSTATEAAWQSLPQR